MKGFELIIVDGRHILRQGFRQRESGRRVGDAGVDEIGHISLFVDRALQPFVGTEHLDLDRTGRTRLHTRGRLPLVQALMAHMALGDDLPLLVIRRHTVGTVPRTVLTADARVVIVKDDAVVELDIALRRATFETGGIDTVVAAHGVEHQQGLGETAAFHLAHTAPLDVRGVVVLLVARDFAAAAGDAGGRVEVETVLLALFELGQIDGVASALHAGLGLVRDKTFQRGLHFFPLSVPASRTGLR